MGKSTEFQEFVGEGLEPLGAVSLRRMFGGCGVFHGDIMFGLVADDTLYFKVDEDTVAMFEAAGGEPFSYARAGARQVMASYYRVPDDVLEDGDRLLAWGRIALAAALKAAKSGKKAGRGGGGK